MTDNDVLWHWKFSFESHWGQHAVGALTWMADAGVELHILQRVAGHQGPAVTSRYLHPDTQAVLDAGAAFSAWWSRSGPGQPSLGVVDAGRSGA